VKHVYTETQQSTNDFDTNGNLLNLNNIGSLKWCYNVAGVRQQILKAFLVLNIGEYHRHYSSTL
jgi:hypothetical protein